MFILHPFIHSLADRCLSCFRLLAVMNKTAVDMSVQMSKFLLLILLGIEV